MLDETQRKLILESWSREVVLILDDKPYQCKCGCVFQMTAGRADRVRCGKCKELLFIEL